MYKRFSEEPTAARRGLQIWQILVGKAHLRQTITYGQLGELIGWQGVGGIGTVLYYPTFYCEANGLPPLAVLVVNQETGRPGVGMTDHVAPESQDMVREDVFNFNWFDVEPPTAQELATAHAAAHVEV